MAPSCKEVPVDDDAELFRQAMRDVRRLPASGRVSAGAARPPPRARQREADDREVLASLLAEPEPDWLEYGETLQYRAPGVQEGVLRKLRRGHYRVDASLDLHGMNRTLAQRTVLRFLADCIARDHRCVRIVHGKGNGSPNTGPVLKRLLDGWLRRRRDVLAFTTAPVADGGTGAVYVLLRVA